MEKKQLLKKRPFLFLLACLTGATVAFGMRSEPSAARPLFGTSLEHYRTTLFADSSLFQTIVRREMDRDVRSRSSVTFTNPRLLVSTPKTDALPLENNMEGLSVQTRFVTQRLVTNAPPIVRFATGMHPGARKIVRRGTPRIVALTERVTQWNSVIVDRQVVNRALLQRGQPAVVVASPPRSVSEAMALMGSRKLVAVYSMMATAYTAGSAQAVPTGRTATGLPARYGVVAVDPRVIPLGSRLYIEGYGTAVAADTGGSIVGNRIDLCMDSYQAAISFGRQPVKVYVLRNK